MTWTVLEQVVRTIGWTSAVVVAVFLLGQFVLRLANGELGKVKLSPMQQIAVDLTELSATVKREISELRAQIGTQFTDVVQRVNGHHVAIRELTDARNNEYERLTQKFYSKEIIDRMRHESEKDREKLREEIASLETRCFGNHFPNGKGPV